MKSRAFVSSTLVSVGLSLAFTLVVGAVTANRNVDVRAATSCFVITGKVACIEAGYVPVVPIVPPVMAPIGPDFDGENEDIVIRDDGGHEVATG